MATEQIQSVERALGVLRIVAEASRPLSLTGIAAEAGLGASTTLRLLRSLERAGHIRRDETKRYRAAEAQAPGPTLKEGLAVLSALGGRSDGQTALGDLTALAGYDEARVEAALALLQEYGLVAGSPPEGYAISPLIMRYARGVFGNEHERRIIRGIMEDLQAAHGETVSWFRRSGFEQVVIEVAASLHPIRYVLEVGSTFPLYVGAGGKAHLAAMPDEVIEPWLQTLEPVTYTRHRTDPAQLAEEVVAIRARGYATSVGERVEGAASVAVPVRGRDGEVAGVISIMMPMFRTSRAGLAEIGNDLIDRTRAAFGPAFASSVADGTRQSA